MEKLHKHFVVLLICLGAIEAHAQVNDPYLLQYRKEAIEHEQLVKMAENTVEVGYQNYKAAMANMMPKIGASADYWYVQNPLAMALPDDPRFGDLAGETLGQGAQHQYGLYTTLTQPIYKGGQLQERKKRADIQYKIASEQLQITSQDVIMATDLQYWQSVAQNELVFAMQNYKNDLSRIAGLVENKVEVGTLDRSDLLMTEVRVNRADLAVIQAENDLKVYKMSLNRILGRPFEDEITLIDSIELEHFQSHEMQMSVRPEYKVAEFNVEKRIKDMNIVKSMYRFQLDGIATASYSAPGYNMLPGAVPNVQAGVMLSIPLFHGGRKQHLVASQQLKVHNEQLALERTKELLDLEIAQKRVAWQNSLKENTVAKMSLTKARQNASVMEERFEEGLIDILEVIDSQLYLEQAVIEYIQSKLKAQIQWTHYVRSMGNLTAN
ncbi:TolC family protein [Flammeovirga sp. EKP202]|uniref:TolC family protein n=1 Tax=Flammeovirga sp. EKP202 TaxID=2770592 RepID=UPI00165F0826|nr:TolC family protein [Flammeovirga sp. EKP202]MBD0402250.1 TolC family protein [Flammeovirga sp. EKP202]